MINHSLRDICKFNKATDYDSYVGLKIVNGEPIIYLPLGYNDDEEILSSDIHNLIVSIKRFSKANHNYTSINDEYNSDDRFPYFAYKWIIENYLEKGYFNELEYEERIGTSGKINWKRTISKPSDIFSKKGPIYTKFIIKKSNIKDTIITRIHEFCVYESYKKLGWLFDNKNSAKKPLLNIDINNKQKYILIIKEELKKTFKDSKKELLLNMIKVLSGIDNNKFASQTYECGTNSYYNVWEKMITKAYSNIKNIEDYYPHGEWHINGNEKKNSALQPDTIIICDSDAYILDSKYYPYCNTRRIDNLPTTDSIQKQITYAEYLDKNYNYNKIYNTFVLPGKEDKKIEYIGYATADWKQNDKIYHKIYSFMIDTKYIINNYDKSPSNYIKEWFDQNNNSSNCYKQ